MTPNRPCAFGRLPDARFQVWPPFVILVLGLLTFALPAAAQRQTAPSAATPDDVLLIADEIAYDERLAIATARGDVELSRGLRVLRADTMSYNQRADVVTASGNVALLEETGDVIFADYFELTGDLKSGAIDQLRILLSDDSRFAASGGRMTADGRTDLAKAVYSPCKLCEDDPTAPPLWQLKAYRITHDKELKMVFYRDAFLEVFGIPVAYFPFFSHPDPTVKRKTGFLLPTIGTDSTLGQLYKQPYFFNISDSQDATIAPIITTNEGTILTGQYREATEAGAYRIDGSVTRDERAIDDPKTSERTRGHLEAEGEFRWGPHWLYGFDVGRATDATYLGRYGFQRGRDSLTSRIYLDGTRQRTFTSANAYAFQSLDPEVDESQQPYVLPLVDFNYKSDPDARFGYVSLDTQLRVIGRSQGANSRLLSLTGGWHLPVVGPWGNLLDFGVSLRGDIYHVTNVPDPRGAPGAKFDGFTGRVVPQAEVVWRYPWVRPTSRGHQVIEPIVQAIVGPHGGNDPTIPNEDSLAFEFTDTNVFSSNRFTGVDRVEGGPRTNYGLRIADVGAGGGKIEALIGQTYRAQTDDTFEPGTGLNEDFSDFVGRVTVAPNKYLDASYRFRIDKENLAVRRGSVSLSAGPAWFKVNVNYSQLNDEPTSGVPRNLEQVNVSGLLKLGDNWSFSARHERDLTSGGGSLYTGFGIAYENECVLVRTRYDRNFTRDFDIEDNTSFIIEVQLRNLG